MKQFNQYILEKLKLDKTSKSKNVSVFEYNRYQIELPISFYFSDSFNYTGQEVIINSIQKYTFGIDTLGFFDEDDYLIFELPIYTDPIKNLYELKDIFENGSHPKQRFYVHSIHGKEINKKLYLNIPEKSWQKIKKL